MAEGTGGGRREETGRGAEIAGRGGSKETRGGGAEKEDYEGDGGRRIQVCDCSVGVVSLLPLVNTVYQPH